MFIEIMLTLPREAVSVPLARHTVSTALERAGVTRGCLAEVKIAISEACTNALQHAGRGESFAVHIRADTEQLTVDVVDDGPGFAGRTPPVGMPDPGEESGRGVALMAAFSDHTAFDSVSGHGSTVHLVKRLRWIDEADAV